ncbi:hypothetical protein [Algoriphagus mannitolivorans]|uniref:hypothetical protein n=1 Tax=Algoriphagus mannitolivorans TaxID=226504 RepID=UPI0012FB42F5|nr:hypothetical protein [Algoriphagus mannitolivorans]
MLFEDLGNSISNEALTQIHAFSKGKKISKGNDLLGFPYQVLDFVRDFDPEKGLDIRILNWFGNGLFLMIYHGEKSQPNPKELLKAGFAFSLAESAWDYPEMILNQAFSKKLEKYHLKKSKPIVWIKELKVPEKTELALNNLQLEIGNLLQILKLSN